MKSASQDEEYSSLSPIGSTFAANCVLFGMMRALSNFSVSRTASKGLCNLSDKSAAEEFEILVVTLVAVTA